MIKRKIALLIFIAAILPGFAVGQSSYHSLVDEAWNAVNGQFWDSTFNGADWLKVRQQFLARNYSTRQSAYIAIAAMLEKLNDPATRFLTPEQFAALLAEFSDAAQVGTGLIELLCVDMNEHTHKLTIVTTLPNTPAARAGLQPRDEIEAINGVPAVGMSLAEAMMRLRGLPGTKVELTIRRRDQQLKFDVPREAIPPQSPVRAFISEEHGRKIGYVALHQFTTASGRQMREAIKNLSQSDASAFVLDLRNNPGGFVPACQEVAGIFLGEKPIAKILGRGSVRSDLLAQGKKLIDKPVAVLVNAGSASAAEALAGALQETKRAMVVGTRTFGKGLMHGFQQLTDNSALMITIGRLETLQGRDILNEGILPDEIMESAASPASVFSANEFTAIDDRQYTRAIEILLQRSPQ